MMAVTILTLMMAVTILTLMCQFVATDFEVLAYKCVYKLKSPSGNSLYTSPINLF
jgi:hypothetical protein